MLNTELPIDIEQQVNLMKRYVSFRQKKRFRDFLTYTGYFRASRHKNLLPVWAAFTYFEMGTITMMYSYLRGDLRKEVLDYAYPGRNYKKK